ncbi:MAG TPA: OB-fold domain-containing protein [Thermodesulfobacteriota bacterium]|nr:OB-fold domain-containing protein [Thermodesulfobacteriota bacterium]
MTRFEKSDLDLRSLLLTAGRQALASSKHPEPEAIFVGAMNPEEFAGLGNIAVLTADALGFVGIPAIRVETASSSGAAVFSVAYTAVASGIFRNVLVAAGEKMSHLPTKTATRILAEVIEMREREAGASMPALAAMITKVYMHRFKIPKEDMEQVLASIAIKNHFNGSLNPLAQFQRRITFTDYRASKFVSEPLRLYDCSPFTDGAAALLLTREKTDVRVAGIGQGTDTFSVRSRGFLTSFMSTRIAAKQAYEMAGIGPKNINFAEIHDAFTSFEIINSEDLGFFEEGSGWEAVRDGVTQIDGQFPINPSGGLKSRGHPVGASGLAQVVESVLQMRGEVNERRQVGRVDRVLTHSIGGMGHNNFVIILEKEKEHVRHPQNVSYYTLPIHLPRSGGNDDIRINEEEGVLETFTVLHVSPDGFPSPLVLGFVQIDGNRRILARSVSIEKYQLGERVKVERKGNTYFFRKVNVKEKLKYYFRLFARRTRGFKGFRRLSFHS